MLKPYKESEYEGEFNLLRNEKVLIQKAWKRTKGSLKEMTKLLQMKERYLLIAIIRHFNEKAP